MQESLYYYLGADPLHSGHYLTVLHLLEQEGLVVNLISRVPLSLRRLPMIWTERHSIGPNPVELARQRIRGRVYQLPLIVRYPTWSALPLARLLGWPCHNDQQRVVVHARQVGMGDIAVAAKRWLPNLRVISELEGDSVAELQYMQDKARQPVPASTFCRRREALVRQERRVVRESDALVCVSTKLKEVIAQRHQLTPREADKIYLFPSVASRQRFCFDPEARRHTRQALELQERYVVVYSGNLNSVWQLPDKLVEVFGWIRQKRPAAFFLILTPEGDRPHIEPYLQQANLSPGDFRLHSCPHNEIVNYLCAADVALLLRERHAMNEVAAPAKFAEYVLTGLPIIMTNGIGDFSAHLRNSEFACILPDLSNAGSVKAAVQQFCVKDFTSAQRAAFGQHGAERFSIEEQVSRLAALYSAA